MLGRRVASLRAGDAIRTRDQVVRGRGTNVMMRRLAAACVAAMAAVGSRRAGRGVGRRDRPRAAGRRGPPGGDALPDGPAAGSCPGHDRRLRLRRPPRRRARGARAELRAGRDGQEPRCRGTRRAAVLLGRPPDRPGRPARPRRSRDGAPEGPRRPIGELRCGAPGRRLDLQARLDLRGRQAPREDRPRREHAPRGVPRRRARRPGCRAPRRTRCQSRPHDPRRRLQLGAAGADPHVRAPDESVRRRLAGGRRRSRPDVLPRRPDARDSVRLADRPRPRRGRDRAGVGRRDRRRPRGELPVLPVRPRRRGRHSGAARVL
jgi:hypothetical protein